MGEGHQGQGAKVNLRDYGFGYVNSFVEKFYLHWVGTNFYVFNVASSVSVSTLHCVL